MTFGVSSGGFQAKRLADILLELQTLFTQRFGSNFDLSTDSPEGQFLGLLAERETFFWELLDQIWQSSFDTTAGGFSLDLIYGLLKLSRLGSAPSVVRATIGGSDGTYDVGTVTGKTADSGQTFVNSEAFTISGGAATDVPMECTVDGPVLCLAGTLTALVSPPVGISTITNPLDGSIGRDPETDADYRLRKQGAISTAKSSSAPGVLLSLLQVPDVTEVVIVQNLTGSTDLDGRPPHSFETCLIGGTDEAIAAALWAGKPAGVATFGNVSTSIVDTHGEAQPLAYSRPTAVPVWIKATVEPGKAFPKNGVQQILAAIVQYGATLRMGQTLSQFPLEAACAGIPGIAQLDFALGLTPTPASEDPIRIGLTRKIAIDSTRITVQRVG